MPSEDFVESLDQDMRQWAGIVMSGIQPDPLATDTSPEIIEEETTVYARGFMPEDTIVTEVVVGALPPPLETGACCVGESCETATHQHCDDTGGIYQGDGTNCVPNPCGSTGACCEDNGEGGTICDDLSEDECDAVGGDFKGIDTSCYDYPNPCATGACCLEGCVCEIYSPAECEDLGGEYQGDNTTCGDSELEEPNPCVPIVTLNCDQICQSGRKCGWPGFYNEGLPTDTYWRDATATTTNTYDHRNGDGNGITCDSSYTSTIIGRHPITLSGEFCDPSDADEIECDGYSICKCYTRVYRGLCEDGCSIGEFCSAGVCCEDGVLIATETCECCGSTCDNYDCDSACTNPAIAFRAGTPLSDTEAYYTGGFSEDTTLFTEITTSELLTTIIDNLPAYSGGWFGICEAKKIDTYEDNSRFTICRFKPKFTFAEATSAFTITYNEHFESQDMTSSSETPRSLFVSIGDTEAMGDEVMEPSTNGTITITDIEVDC